MGVVQARPNVDHFTVILKVIRDVVTSRRPVNRDEMQFREVRTMWGYALVIMRLASTSVFTGAAKLSEASFSVFNTASGQAKSLEHSTLHNLTSLCGL